MPDIERLDASSWARLCDVRLRALRDAPDAFGSTLEAEEARDRRTWERLATLGPWWLAVDEGADIGLVAGGRNDRPGVPWVYSMWVEEPWRGSGLAEALLDAVVAWAINEGATTLGLDVTDRVPRARAFYERYGFVATGDVVPLPRDPSIKLAVMLLDLSTHVLDPP